MALPTLPVDMTGNTEVADAQVLSWDSQVGVQVAAALRPYITVSSIAPTFSAPKGTVCIALNGSSATTRLFVNTNGTTGWTSITTAT